MPVDLTDQDRLMFARIQFLLEELTDRDDRIIVPPPDLTEIVQAIQGLKGPASPAELREALEPLFQPPSVEVDTSEMARSIQELRDIIDHRLQGLGKAFGASGPSNIAGDPNRELGRTTTSGGREIANEITLQQIRDYLDTVETKLQTLITETQRRPTYKVANGLISVPAGAAFTTVVDATPTVAFTVQGFGADLNSTAALTYHYRLITGTDASPTVIDMEQISAGDNSKRALLLSVAANTRVAIQVNHAEVTAQEFRATLNWSEEP